MIYLRSLVLIVLISSSFETALAQPTRLPASLWQEDLRQLAATLPVVHPNLFTQTPRVDFDLAVGQLDSAIPNMPDAEIIAGFARITALGHDAHTSLGLNQTAAGFEVYPLRVRWFTDGLYVVQTAPQYRAALGKRVVAIGSQTIDEVYETLKPFISHENEAWARRMTETYLFLADLLYAAGISSSSQSAVFTVESQDGSRTSVEFSAASPTSPVIWLVWPDPDQILQPLYTKDPQAFYWYQYLSESKALYVKYNNCRESAALSFAAFTEQVLSFVDANPVERLVIDVRSNPGGNSAIIRPLFTGLGERAMNGQFGPNSMGYVIIGRETFSSGMLNAIEAKLGGAILVGEPTGGKPNGYGEVRILTLSHSGLNVGYSTRFFNALPGVETDSLVPDISTPISSADYAAGRDPALDAILQDAPDSTSVVPFGLYSGGGVSLKTKGVGVSPRVGFARITATADWSMPGGIAIFAYKKDGVTVSEASVPATPLLSSGRIPVQSAGPLATGVALANPNSEPAQISFYFTNANGEDFGHRSMTLEPGNQIARFLHEDPFQSGTLVDGTFTFETSAPVAVIALRGLLNQRNDFLITTLPVVSLAAGTTPDANIPHFAEGGGWKTEVILVNPSSAPAGGFLELRAPDGQVYSQTPYTLASRGARTIAISSNSTTIRSGSARIVPEPGMQPPVGLVVFSYQENGVTVTETGVGVVPSRTKFRLFAQASGFFGGGETGSMMSGFAIMNPNASTVTVNASLALFNGTVARVAQGITIPPMGQTATFLNQVPGWENLGSPFQAVLEITSDAPVSMTGLRGRYNERGEFLTAGLAPFDPALMETPLFFSHLVDAGGYTTQFIFVDPSQPRTASGTVRFFDQSGSPLNLVVR